MYESLVMFFVNLYIIFFVINLIVCIFLIFIDHMADMDCYAIIDKKAVIKTSAIISFGSMFFWLSLIIIIQLEKYLERDLLDKP